MPARYSILDQKAVITQICKTIMLEDELEFDKETHYISCEDEAYFRLNCDNINSFYEGMKFNQRRLS